MGSLFDTKSMAAGYARCRPPLHPRIFDLVRPQLRPLVRALDVGCGAGLSTAPLSSIAEQCFGIEPSIAMLEWTRETAPRAFFAAACAEAIPFAASTFELIAAGGSLNWADLDTFFSEVRRVLTPGGYLLIYDFGLGRDLRDSTALRDWEATFKSRWPSPPCRAITPETLEVERRGFRLRFYEEFQIPLELSSEFYLEYVLTETNVAAAISSGFPAAEIREWCRSTLEPVFEHRPREVLFRGYAALIVDNGKE